MHRVVRRTAFLAALLALSLLLDLPDWVLFVDLLVGVIAEDVYERGRRPKRQ